MKDPDSRQAVVHFNTPDYAFKDVKDFPCTMYLQFMIRESKLFLIVNMRSNDLVKGVPYDWSWFMYLHRRMLAELRQKYEQLGVGSYIHNAGSLHLYEEDFELARKMLG